MGKGTFCNIITDIMQFCKRSYKAGVPIESKNPLLVGKKNVFEYELTKDRRYTVDKGRRFSPQH